MNAQTAGGGGSSESSRTRYHNNTVGIPLMAGPGATTKFAPEVPRELDFYALSTDLVRVQMDRFQHGTPWCSLGKVSDRLFFGPPRQRILR